MHEVDTMSLDKIACFYIVAQLRRIKIFNIGIIAFIDGKEFVQSLKIFEYISRIHCIHYHFKRLYQIYF